VTGDVDTVWRAGERASELVSLATLGSERSLELKQLTLTPAPESSSLGCPTCHPKPQAAPGSSGARTTSTGHKADDSSSPMESVDGPSFGRPPYKRPASPTADEPRDFQHPSHDLKRGGVKKPRTRSSGGKLTRPSAAQEELLDAALSQGK